MTLPDNDSGQTIWEAWFLISVILFLTTMYMGTFEGSKEMFPNFDIWLILISINLGICIRYGLKKH